MNENEYYEMMKEKMDELIHQQRKANIRLAIIEILIVFIIIWSIIIMVG